METLDHTIISCLAPFILPLYAKKPSEYCDLLMPTAGIEPGPPAQQATALSITPLHLGIKEETRFKKWS